MAAIGESSDSRSDSRPFVLILTLDKPDFFTEMYAGFTDMLKTRADVQHVTTPAQARSALVQPHKPVAILAADESLTKGTRTSLVQEIRTYVQSGGILVFMGLFSSFSRPPDINALFSKFDLPWESGDYHRTTFNLNPRMTHFDSTALAPSYSQKALHVANAAQEDAVYLPAGDASVQSMVFGGMGIGDRTQTPAALTKVGMGKVGYIGDVNNEEETPAVVLAMCGL